MGASLFGGAGVTVNVDRTIAAGTHIENEPIIKSDGAGEMMQWQPSDGGADGMFVVQNASDGAVNLGVGITPTVGNLQVNDASGAIIGVTRTAGSNNDDLGTIRFGNTDVDSNLVNIIASQDGSTDSGRVTFETQASGGATSARMAINSTGTMSLTANDPQLILSDSAGTNKLVELRSNNGAVELVSRDNAANGAFKFIGEAGSTETTQLEISAAGQVQIGSGSVSAPALAFIGDTDTGIWRPGSNQLRLATTGVDRLTIDGSGVVSIPSGSITLGSLDIGHGAGNGTGSTAIGEFVYIAP